jgi:hypothetical protein
MSSSLIRYLPTGHGSSSSIQRPLPSPSPTNTRQLHIFNSNSNSGDSHEVARYMSLPSPGGIYAPPKTPETSTTESHHQQHYSYPHRIKPTTPIPPTGSGAFSSVNMKDPANSIVNNSELLRARLAKPSPSLSTTTKYQTLRKEFLSKSKTPVIYSKLIDSNTPERKKLTMLHFAIWNPP